MTKLHLAVLQPNVPADSDSEPSQATRLYKARRTEFRWVDGLPAFRAVSLRWWDDRSYAAYECGADEFDNEGHVYETNVVPVPVPAALLSVVPSSIDSDEIPF